MESDSSGMDWPSLPYGKWTESHLSCWLTSIGIKENYIRKLEEEEVTAPAIMCLQKDYFSNTIGMKSGQLECLLHKRHELLKLEPNADLKTNSSSSSSSAECSESKLDKASTDVSPSRSKAEPTPNPQPSSPESHDNNTHPQDNDTVSSGAFLTPSRYRKFDEQDQDFKYVKHSVLPPETGIENMIAPCHEYKSLEIAQKLEPKKLQAKVACEVLRFACACMNMRTNGTIHFGVMDKVKRLHQHGEIEGVQVNEKEDFVDALDYIERCFDGFDQQSDARDCIRNPKFVDVVDNTSVYNICVIEYDIVPKSNTVKDKLYSVGIPKFSEKKNRVILEDKVPYCRVGANTPQIQKTELVPFIQGLKEKDAQRKEAESTCTQTPVEYREDQKRKLSILLTCGSKNMDDSRFYIIVTNKLLPEHLDTIGFLIHMNLFCVFDFDPDSKMSGLCGKYKEHHAASLHFMHDYDNTAGLSTADFIKHLKLFDRTSWIFCNGRNDFSGGEKSCNEKTWIKTRKKQMKKAVSIICNDILPKHSFVVVFLLMSDVEQPVVETFHEFYAEMNGHEFLAVISESKENYKKWSNLAQVSCNLDTLKDISIIDMPLSHVDATVQSIQVSKNRPAKTLPAFSGGLCFLKSVEEDLIHSLEIISVDQCEDTKLELMDKDKLQHIEQDFYRGGKIDWQHLWLAERQQCGEIIQRDAYKEANKIMEDLMQRNAIRPIESINVYHHPGSGGTTVARQLLWSWKSKVRCAVVRHSKEIHTVCEHALRLRELDEKEQDNCLPVLLLIEDCNADYTDDVRRELGNAIATKKIKSVLCFILLICKRSHVPERMCRASPSQTIAVTHKLTIAEKVLFTKKAEELKLTFKPEFILTYVLMCNEFHPNYIEDFVKNILHNIDHSSPTTRLIRFVALLNCYIHESYISVSHCEMSLGIGMHLEKIRYHAFEDHLSDEAKLFFIHLRDGSTNISCIRIIHPLVAKEILIQLSKKSSQGDIAMDLINDKLLIHHKFGRENFLSFIRALLIRRKKVSRGDNVVTTFLSPLIEHVSAADGVQKAVDLMTAAFTSLGKDALVAQQLARLLYTNFRFEEALKWAVEAKSLLPDETFVLDTLGQVYKRWFYYMYDTLEEKEPSPERSVEIISIALKGICAFRASEKKTKKEKVSLYRSSYGELDVGCSLLKFLSGVNVFSNNRGHSEMMKYLLTDYIPADVEKPWQKFHSQLKGLQKSLYNALECMSEDLTYFQTESSKDDEELDANDPEQVCNPRKWLTKKSVLYASFFFEIPGVEEYMMNSESSELSTSTERFTHLQRQMKTYQLGGGNVTSILALINDRNPEKARKTLETIIDMYPENLKRNDLDQTELTNFIFCQIALNCTFPGSSKLLSLQKLQELSMGFNTKGGYISPASSLFLLSLLLWPQADDNYDSQKSKKLESAIDTLQMLFEQKNRQMSPRKTKSATHFFLAKARGLNKIVHRSAIEKHIKGTLSERRLKWLGGEVWKTQQVAQTLKRVDGWTKNGSLFIHGAKKHGMIRIITQHYPSLPNGNENVTFYLGFSFNGAVAYDIQVSE